MVYDQKIEQTYAAIHGTDDIISTFHAAFVYLTKVNSSWKLRPNEKVSFLVLIGSQIPVYCFSSNQYTYI